MHKETVSHFSAVSIIYCTSRPSLIHIDRKDNGFPTPSVRGTLCPVGGNCNFATTSQDKTPLQTLRREIEEERTVDRQATCDQAEIMSIGYDEKGVNCGKRALALANEVDHQAMINLKRIMKQKAKPFGLYMTSIEEKALTGCKRKPFRVAVSYFTVALSAIEWQALTRLQEKFGNISSESNSTIIDLDDPNENWHIFSFGHHVAFRDFLKQFTGVPQETVNRLIAPEGFNGYRIGDIRTTYANLLKEFTLEN